MGSGRVERRRPSRAAVLAAALAAAVGLGACAGSGFQYVKSSEANAYFKVPEDWELYDEDAILEREAGELSPEQLEVSKQSQWLTAFDADPQPSLDHLFARLTEPTDHPVGVAHVRALAPDERDALSLAALRSQSFGGTDPVAVAEQGDERVEVLRNEDVVRPGGLHGNHLVVSLRLEDGPPVTVNQTALVDDATRLLYLFRVTCESQCYAQNEKLIDDIVESWTVKER